MNRLEFLRPGSRTIGRSKNGRIGRVDLKKALNHMEIIGFNPKQILGHRPSRVGGHHGPRKTILRTGGIQMPGQDTHQTPVIPWTAGADGTHSGRTDGVRSG